MSVKGVEKERRRMGENLDKYLIKDHVKRREHEKKGMFVGIELLNGDKVFGVIEETRPNVFVVRDNRTDKSKSIHRALIKKFMYLIDGGVSE